MASNQEALNNPVQVTDLNSKDVMRKLVENGQEVGFFLCDLSDIVEKYQKWNRAMSRVKPFYAIKACDIRVVLETLATLGTGFDCASTGEIMKVLSLGVSPNRIIFANPTKTMAQLKYACQVGVTKMTFDCEDELHKIKKVFPDAELVLRIKYDDPSALYVLGKKFGADPNTEAKKLLNLAKSLHLNVIGVAFHIGSGSKNYTIYQNAIASAKNVFDIGSDLGFKFHILDIGGGFPGNKNDVIFEIGTSINDALEKYFPDTSVQVMSEPGKYFVDSAFMLMMSIHTTKTVDQRNEENVNTTTKIYYTNISMYQSLMPIPFGESYIPLALFDKPDVPIYQSIVWGSTCDSCDRLSDLIDLPELENGDWIYFENAGAYTITLSCEFNGYPTTAVHSIINNKDWLLLTKEVEHPIPENRFIVSNDLQHFMPNLKNPYCIYNKYF